MKNKPTEVTLISIYHVFQGCLTIMASIILLAVTLLIYFAEPGYTGSSPMEVSFAAQLTMGIFFIVAIMLSIFAILYFVAAYGIFNLKKWGRILSIIVAALDLLNIPVGTIAGVLILIFLLDEENAKLFN